jgi:maltose/moltooligosaccharide transporter
MATIATGPTILGEQKYTCGTLSYTKAGLLVLFVWLLWGDFCFTLMEGVLGIFPLYMIDHLGASNKTTALLMTIIPNIFGVIVGPAVSFKSDRHRGPHGRRIPYIIWTAPILVLALIGLGFSDFFHRGLQVSSLPEYLHIHPMTASLLVIGLFMIVFAFMNEFVNSVYWYLFADVVPEQFLGRFLALFRLVGAGAGALYGAFIFPYAEVYMHWIFLGIALLYLFGFALMCWRVKEGEYPPPDDLGEKPSILKQANTYIRECFSHPIYILMFAYTALQMLARSAGIGGLVFNKDALGISLQQMGLVGAVSAFISMGLQFPSGWLVDKFHPLRMTLAMQLFVTPLQFVMFFFMVGFKTYVGFEAFKLVIFSLYGAAGLPLLITVFPKDKYGQYCSCNGMMKSLAAMVGAATGAAFIDIMTNNGVDKDAYRWMFMWGGVFQALSVVALVAIYWMWKQHGGDAGYAAPGSALEKQKTAQEGGPA